MWVRSNEDPRSCALSVGASRCNKDMHLRTNVRIMMDMVIHQCNRR